MAKGADGDGAEIAFPESCWSSSSSSSFFSLPYSLVLLDFGRGDGNAHDLLPPGCLGNALKTMLVLKYEDKMTKYAYC